VRVAERRLNRRVNRALQTSLSDARFCTTSRSAKAQYGGISWLDYVENETPDGAMVLHKFGYTFNSGTLFVQAGDYSRGTNTVMTQSYSRNRILFRQQKDILCEQKRYYYFFP
jgi:hypothetical protein